MCKDKAHGGQRCVDVTTAYGQQYRNLKAKEQYSQRKLRDENLSPEKRKQVETKLQKTVNDLQELETHYTNLGPGKHFTLPVNANTEKVLGQLKADGLTPYIVGGSVRDVLLNLNNKDIDIEVYGGDANQVIASLKKVGRVDEVGKAFGVLKVQLGDDDFDISLPRRDSLTGEGHTGFDVEVDPHMTLVEASGRRDFTINALMYDHENQYIIDNHGGLKDLKNRTLKHVTDAFDEDPLRVLRGVQMASRFGFTLHPDTIVKAQTLKNQYSSLSIERVQIEFQKLYNKGLASQEGLKILQATEWDENFPGLEEVNNQQLWDNVTRMQETLKNTPELNSRKDMFLSACISKTIENPQTRHKFLSATCVGDKVKNEAFALTEMSSPQTVSEESMKHWARDFKKGGTIQDWVVLQKSYGVDVSQVEATAKKANVLTRIEPDYLTGNDIMDFMNKPAGKWVGEVVTKTRAAQYAGKFNSKESGLAWLEQNFS